MGSSPTALAGTDRRRAILDAAAVLVARHGIDGTSMADVAAAVGLTAPALYRHVGGKEALLDALARATVDRFSAVVAPAGEPLPALEVQIADLVTAVLDDPAPALAYLRERHRAGGDDALAPLERALFTPVAEQLHRRRPDLDEVDLGLRIIGGVGAMGGIAATPPALARPALDRFVAEAVLGVLLAPAVAPSPDPAAGVGAPPQWAPVPSVRQRVLNAALERFTARGYEATGIGEIGEAAGVGASNVHRHATGKAELLVDLYDAVAARVEVALDVAVAGAVDATDALRRMVAALTGEAFAAAALVVVVGQARAALPAEERPRLRRREGRLTDRWRSVLAEARPELRPGEVATLVAGVLPMVVLYPQQLHLALPAPTAVAPLVEAFLLGPAAADG